MLTRIIPASGERIPAVGMGTWDRFDVPEGPDRDRLLEVARDFFAAGGAVFDSSPMYGRSEEALGGLLARLKDATPFLATKVWTRGRREGLLQMEESLRRMRVDRIALMQVHNLVDWEAHVPTLREWKASGRIRYWGLTHYHDSAHAELERVAAKEHPDFLQFNYSIASTAAENRLLPFAREQGIAVLANRPFGEGELFRRVRGKSLPDWAREAGCGSWGAAFLKYILSHPGVTCAIPATGSPSHLAENLALGSGPDLGEEQRRAWARHIKNL